MQAHLIKYSQYITSVSFANVNNHFSAGFVEKLHVPSSFSPTELETALLVSRGGRDDRKTLV